VVLSELSACISYPCFRVVKFDYFLQGTDRLAIVVCVWWRHRDTNTGLLQKDGNFSGFGTEFRISWANILSTEH